MKPNPVTEIVIRYRIACSAKGFKHDNEMTNVILRLRALSCHLPFNGERNVHIAASSQVAWQAQIDLIESGQPTLRSGERPG